MLWFAFKLVSLNHWKQLNTREAELTTVVICFQISIFEPLKTTSMKDSPSAKALWFAFKLVSLNHWKQPLSLWYSPLSVVICFQISIFEPLKTTSRSGRNGNSRLWFAFKLVSLNHWKQPNEADKPNPYVVICFQISIFEPLKTTSKTKKHLWDCCDLLSN